MVQAGSFSKLYVPFEFIQKHNGKLAIDIQDGSPGSVHFRIKLISFLSYPRLFLIVNLFVSLESIVNW